MKISAREMQIVTLIARGLGNKQIAAALFISQSTVRKHRQNIYRKLQIKNSAELTTYAIQSSLVQAEDYSRLNVHASLLTAREIQVMRLVAMGCDSREISSEMQIAYSTVRKHRENIHLKLGIRNCAEITAFYRLKITPMPN